MAPIQQAPSLKTKKTSYTEQSRDSVVLSQNSRKSINPMHQTNRKKKKKRGFCLKLSQIIVCNKLYSITLVIWWGGGGGSTISFIEIHFLHWSTFITLQAEIWLCHMINFYISITEKTKNYTEHLCSNCHGWETNEIEENLINLWILGRKFSYC